MDPSDHGSEAGGSQEGGEFNEDSSDLTEEQGVEAHDEETTGEDGRGGGDDNAALQRQVAQLRERVIELEARLSVQVPVAFHDDSSTTSLDWNNLDHGTVFDNDTLDTSAPAHPVPNNTQRSRDGEIDRQMLLPPRAIMDGLRAAMSQIRGGQHHWTNDYQLIRDFWHGHGALVVQTLDNFRIFVQSGIFPRASQPSSQEQQQPAPSAGMTHPTGGETLPASANNRPEEYFTTGKRFLDKQLKRKAPVTHTLRTLTKKKVRAKDVVSKLGRDWVKKVRRMLGRRCPLSKEKIEKFKPLALIRDFRRGGHAAALDKVLGRLIKKREAEGGKKGFKSKYGKCIVDMDDEDFMRFLEERQLEMEQDDENDEDDDEMQGDSDDEEESSSFGPPPDNEPGCGPNGGDSSPSPGAPGIAAV